jgi:hypothetical protein
MLLLQTENETPEMQAASTVLGPYEKKNSRITAKDLVLLSPPPWTNASRMLASVYWAGYQAGDAALGEHLLLYPRLLQEVIRTSGREARTVCRICIPTKQGRWIGKGFRNSPAYVGAHAILSRAHRRSPWELSTRSSLDGERLILALVR